MATTVLDPYGILGVAPDASQAEVEAAYRARLLLLHPDRMAGRSEREREAAARMLSDLQDAWALVGDARARARYDSEHAPRAEPEPEPEPAWEPAQGPAWEPEPQPAWEPERSRPVARRARRGPWWWRAATWPLRAAWRQAGAMAAQLSVYPSPVPILFFWPVGSVLVGILGFGALLAVSHLSPLVQLVVLVAGGLAEVWWAMVSARAAAIRVRRALARRRGLG